MTNAEKANQLLKMLQQNCSMTIRQYYRDQMNLAAAQAELKKWQELDEPGGIGSPQTRVDAVTRELHQSTKAAAADKEMLEWATERICGMIPENQRATPKRIYEVGQSDYMISSDEETVEVAFKSSVHVLTHKEAKELSEALLAAIGLWVG